MTPFHKLSRILKSEDNTGFGTYSNNNEGRYYDKNGMPNVRKKGLGFLESKSWYHTLIYLSNGYFFGLIFAGFIGINLLFTIIYAFLGIENLSGIDKGTPFENFMELFFFSTQTFTTVGYGRISPVGFLVSSVATFEAFIGLLSFALATGLFYGRFSKPVSHIRFSNNVLFSPFLSGTALMFRIAPYKNCHLTDVEVKLTLAIREQDENGIWKNKFYPLETNISKINMLILSWTIVHKIDENSPFHSLTDVDLTASSWELLVFIKGFDEAYSNTVITRTSYLNTDAICNAKFNIMHGPDPNRNTTILDFDLLHSYSKL